MFPHIFDKEEDEDLQFVAEGGEDIQNVLRQPPIGRQLLMFVLN